MSRWLRADGLLGSIYVADVVRSGADKGYLALACPRTPPGSDDGRLRPRWLMLWRGHFTSTRFNAALLPDSKFDRLQTIRAEGHIVAMVGDGVNDTPGAGGSRT